MYAIDLISSISQGTKAKNEILIEEGKGKEYIITGFVIDANKADKEYYIRVYPYSKTKYMKEKNNASFPMILDLLLSNPSIELSITVDKNTILKYDKNMWYEGVGVLDSYYDLGKKVLYYSAK